MADDFDVEAMLEAPYRKVGCRITETRPVFTVMIYSLSPFYIFATVTKFS